MNQPTPAEANQISPVYRSPSAANVSPSDRRVESAHQIHTTFSKRVFVVMLFAPFLDRSKVKVNSSRVKGERVFRILGEYVRAPRHYLAHCEEPDVFVEKMDTLVKLPPNSMKTFLPSNTLFGATFTFNLVDDEEEEDEPVALSSFAAVTPLPPVQKDAPSLSRGAVARGVGAKPPVPAATSFVGASPAASPVGASTAASIAASAVGAPPAASPVGACPVSAPTAASAVGAPPAASPVGASPTASAAGTSPAAALAAALAALSGSGSATAEVTDLAAALAAFTASTAAPASVLAPLPPEAPPPEPVGSKKRNLCPLCNVLMRKPRKKTNESKFPPFEVAVTICEHCEYQVHAWCANNRLNPANQCPSCHIALP